MTTRLHFFCCFFFLKESLKTGEMSSGNMQMHSVTVLCLSFLNQSIQLNGAKPLMQVRGCQLSTQPTLRLGRLCFWVSERQCMPSSSIDTFPLCSTPLDVFQICFLLLMTPLVSVGSTSAAQCQQGRAACGRLREQPNRWSGKGLTPRTDIRCCHPLQESTEHTVLLEKCDQVQRIPWRHSTRLRLLPSRVMASMLEMASNSRSLWGKPALWVGMELDCLESVVERRMKDWIGTVHDNSSGRPQGGTAAVGQHVHTAARTPPKSRAEHFIPATNFPDTA